MLIPLDPICFPLLVARSKDTIDEKQLSSWKLLDDLRALLAKAQGVFDPELRKQVFLEFASEILTSWGDARLAHPASTTASSKNSASSASRLLSASATNREWKSSRNSL